jgi:hypothetical protein
MPHGIGIPNFPHALPSRPGCWDVYLKGSRAILLTASDMHNNGGFVEGLERGNTAGHSGYNTGDVVEEPRLTCSTNLPSRRRSNNSGLEIFRSRTDQYIFRCCLSPFGLAIDDIVDNGRQERSVINISVGCKSIIYKMTFVRTNSLYTWYAR